MLQKWVLQFRWWWLSWRHRDTPQHQPWLLLRYCQLLDEQLFANYDPLVAARVEFSNVLNNVNDFLSRVVSLQRHAERQEYITHSSLVVIGDHRRINVDEFLLTRGHRHPVHPTEFLFELTVALQATVEALDKPDMDPQYKDYFLRKSEWVYHDALIVIEALYRLARTL